VLNTISEEDQIHLRVRIRVVNIEQLVESRNQRIRFGQFDVVALTTLKITEDCVGEVLQLPVHCEMILHDLVCHLVESISVLIVDQTVTENSEGLAHVQVDQVFLIWNVLISAHEHALDHFGHIAQVERVVTLGRRRQEIIDGLLVDLNRRLDNTFSHERKTTTLLQVKVTSQNRCEDDLHGCL